jgi:hypothetical protein
MLVSLLLFVPLLCVLSLSTAAFKKYFDSDIMEIKFIGLMTSTINIQISLVA